MNKLTYEQCKELKDAGFPQEENGNRFYCNKELCGRNYDDCDQEVVRIPTLEELIEELGENLSEMKQYVLGQWSAHSPKNDVGVGASLITAVYNLYLALNKK